jgi:hypothetical protein
MTHQRIVLINQRSIALTDFVTASAPSARLHWLLRDDREARAKEPSMMVSSSKHQQRVGHVTKQGNTLLR